MRAEMFSDLTWKLFSCDITENTQPWNTNNAVGLLLWLETAKFIHVVFFINSVNYVKKTPVTQV